MTHAHHHRYEQEKHRPTTEHEGRRNITVNLLSPYGELVVQARLPIESPPLTLFYEHRIFVYDGDWHEGIVYREICPHVVERKYVVVGE
jgi:hypothetical protein